MNSEPLQGAVTKEVLCRHWKTTNKYAGMVIAHFKIAPIYQTAHRAIYHANDLPSDADVASYLGGLRFAARPTGQKGVTRVRVSAAASADIVALIKRIDALEARVRELEDAITRPASGAGSFDLLRPQAF